METIFAEDYQTDTIHIVEIINVEIITLDQTQICNEIEVKFRQSFYTIFWTQKNMAKKYLLFKSGKTLSDS